ncbi:P-type conjugative transfer protein VirB9 [Muribacter muris]|uniref:P-type conjugative transfer protein VirB9 n=1 Tax=Muribacter muris TaxID=67855 RepID=A0A4Y9JR33_9PAST|nr:P-type conjugative transfer protein VirB9 [Muribacter muris]MBF0786020.1 P-type conjugative transfer protein VirB9 [Muribacter muris]MBF0826802.1 P-type conjugative transfer protein VirB9 [Muribacter muris]TFV08151.1 P-type conjugative transfer protein VirB9 [Muribacter muris]
MRKISLAIIISLLSQGIYAASAPVKSRYDSRMQTQTYNALDVTEIKVKDGFATAILFDNDERILDMASGFSDGWEFKDTANVIYVKPVALEVEGEEGNKAIFEPKLKEWDTNFLVMTNKRNYVFDLILVEDLKKASYQVNFRYPQEERRNAQKKAAQAKENAEKEQIESALQKIQTPRNWDFSMKVRKGSETIAPDYAYDDGLFTYLGFARDKTFPAAFLLEGKQESLLNTHVRENGRYQVLVIQKTAEKIVLRSGDKVVGIFNGSYGKNPAPYNTTISNEITRDVVGGE